MELLDLIPIATTIITAGGWYLSARKNKSEIRVNETQGQKNIAEAAEVAANASKTAQEIYSGIISELNQNRTSLEKRVDELEAHKGERETRIVALESRIETDVLETQSLKNEVQLLRKQIAEGETKYKELEKKYLNSKQAIEILVKALQDAHIDIPAGLEILLGDSISKLKAIK